MSAGICSTESYVRVVPEPSLMTIFVWFADKGPALARACSILARISGGTSSSDPYVVVARVWGDRKSTRLNSSHGYISYAVFCLKKKKQSNNACSYAHSN